MSIESPSQDKSAPSRKDGGKMPDLDGWRHIAGYGCYLIYAKDDMRRVVNPATGRITTQYRV